MDLRYAMEMAEKEVRSRLDITGSVISDEEVLHILESFVFSNSELKELSGNEQTKLIVNVFFSIRKDMGILHSLTEDDDISEIMVNGKDDIFIEKHGHIVRTDLFFRSEAELEEIIRRIAGSVQREFNELNPILDARLPDGSRVNAIFKNIAMKGPILTIRKFPDDPLTMTDLVNNGTLTEDAAEFLQKLVVCGYNIFISGGTSSGKTTLLNVLSDSIPSDERIIVIEDSIELQINSIDNIVRLECRTGNSQGKGRIEMSDLIKTSLRMRPDRIIVGEVRGAEAVDMIQAMNTGHDGSLSTGHGNSIEGMLNRLESMYRQGADVPLASIRGQINAAIDLIVHLGKIPGGARRVMEIAELDGFDENGFKTNSLYRYDIEKQILVSDLHSLHNKDKLLMRGYGIRCDR